MTILKKLETIQKELKAPKGQTNAFGKYKYRSAEDILEAVKPLLNDCILNISDTIEHLGDRYYVKATVTLKDIDGEITSTAYARESEDKKGMDSAQITGAASSYARKYAMNGMFAIDDTKDADTMDNSKPVERTVKKNKVPESAYKKTLKALEEWDAEQVVTNVKNFDWSDAPEWKKDVEEKFKLLKSKK